MNKLRRKELQELHKRIEEASHVLENINVEIESLRNEERDYIDNMPESLQDSERVSAAVAAVDAMEIAMDSMGIAEDSCIDACNSLEDVLV